MELEPNCGASWQEMWKDQGLQRIHHAVAFSQHHIIAGCA
jgi:hypothetical protein